jgi:hypothetical protein
MASVGIWILGGISGFQTGPDFITHIFNSSINQYQFMKTSSQGYGLELSASEINEFLHHVHDPEIYTSGEKDVIRPVCIWGRAGIGKTQLVKSYAAANGFDFAYIAPAQFEEMGDFHGLPQIGADGRMTYAVPHWVPRPGRPGILLIDDFNRADERILKGLMQLFQDHRLMSWDLPANWNIVCTANPEHSDYAVTMLDEAMLTRLLHVSMTFDAKNWAAWASAHGIDDRGIAFVLTYPESAIGRLTNPRTLTSFFRHTAGIRDLKASARLVNMLGCSLLDRETITSFMTYITDELDRIPSPEEILDTSDFETVSKRLKSMVVKKNSIRLDILGALCTRLVLHLRKQGETGVAIQNLLLFMKLPFLPNDLRAPMHMEVIKELKLAAKAVAGDRELAKMILG